MAVHSFRRRSVALHLFFACFIYLRCTAAFTGSVYQLDTEYSGANFFQGWDFFTGGDPTGGFVTYYSQSSAQLTGLINASDSSPVYIGSDYNTLIGSTQAAGRPSVRISTKRSWTHGLFIGDFNHAPGGICGTWPAFWTLGPNWPNNGEIDIMEGVNQATYNAATLHTSPVCSIAGDSRTMTGQLSNNDCAYYPGYNVGCGVRDNRTTSFGSGFNAVGGGVYAMHWTSDYVRVWFFPRNLIPADIINKTPNPSSWGLPAANLQGSCIIDQHFQSHKVILNNAFCGEYAGASSVWNSTTNSCATSTGYSTCNAYVAGVPGAFQNAYWSINSIRIYQLLDSSPNATNTIAPYIASNQPTQSTAVSTTSSSTPVPTTSLCPTYNFTVVQSGLYNYEIECGVNIGGSDLGRPYPSYSYTNFEGCVGGCTYWNTYNATNICGGVTYNVANNACYWKRNVGSSPAQAGFNSARLIYYAYPQVTDDPRMQTTSSSSTSYVATSVTPVYYSPPGVTTTTSFSLITETPTANITNGGGMGGSISSTDDTTSTSTDAGTTSSQSHSYTGSSSFGSSTTSTLSALLSSSTSRPIPTSATTLPTTSSLVPISSSPAAMTALPPTSATTTTQLSTRSSISSSTLSSLIPSSATSAGTSNHGSTSAQATSAQSPILSSSSPVVSVSSAHATSSTISQTQPHSSYATTTTPGVTTHINTSSSMSLVPSSSSSPVGVSSVLNPPSSMLTSSVPASLSPSTNPAGPTTSSIIMAQSSSQGLSSSAPISQTTSPSQQPPTSDSPSGFPTTLAPQVSSTSSDPVQPSVSTTAVASTSEPSTTTTTSEILPGPTEVVSENGASFSFAGCLGPRSNTAFANSFTLVEDSPSMSIERCVSDCSLDVFAGLYDT
ncbi:hypothetical protein G647_02450 [Cladophialophora carrionii CBS 160.54]|uniref:endo-1,3(4)-beta-glucanase n=1 Tax=Cladophialophora carrionii CBS 160.54 TaxID=1279043 RepID=V9DG63_9EURO|nr:uncharacterized protein G647_02450 [Cladophialophora carrionii CBS 160.54]ETI25676.1 hypothetical protein G647_02450 [Cladophialophora carrionii CBS 160.54]